MALTTVSELDAMPTGSAIRVNDITKNVWTKADGGWTRDGVPRVPSSFFAGLVESGRVTDWSQSDPEVGDIYREGAYWYLFIYVQGERTSFIQWRGTVLRQRYERTLQDVRGWRRAVKVRTDEAPDWLQTVAGQVRVLNLMESQRRQYADSLAQAQEENRHLTDEVTTLRSTATRDAAERAQSRPGVVVVDVAATSEVPGEKAEGHVPEAAEVLSTTARWKVRLRYETTGVGCLCAQVTDEWVAEQIGVEAEVVYSTDCGRH